MIKQSGRTSIPIAWQKLMNSGAKGGGIYIGNEEPTDPNVKLWVNPEAEDSNEVFQYRTDNGWDSVITIDDTVTKGGENPVSGSSVYNTVFPETQTAQPSGGFAPNIVYILGTISNDTTFTLAEPSDANINNHYYFTFDTGETVPTITWPVGITWLNDEIPTLEANTHYEVSIRNNYAIIGGF